MPSNKLRTRDHGEEANDLSAAQRSRIRRLSKPRTAEQGEEVGELNIVPYLDIIMNIVVFVIATLSVSWLASIDLALAKPTKPSQGPSGSSSYLAVLITNDGIALKTAKGNIAADCRDNGLGISVPKTASGHDYAALRRCARRIKNSSASFGMNDQVTVTANPGQDLQTVVAVVDALRGDDQGPLFGDVLFGVVR